MSEPAQGAKENDGLLKKKVEALMKNIDKPIQKSVMMDLLAESGNVKKTLAKMVDLEAESNLSRDIAPARSVRARAAVLNAKSILPVKKLGTKKASITPIRRNHSVKEIVTNINRHEEILPEIPVIESTEPLKVSKLKEVLLSID